MEGVSANADADADDGYNSLGVIPAQEESAAQRAAQERRDEEMLAGIQTPDVSAEQSQQDESGDTPEPSAQPTPPQSTGRTPEAEDLATEERLRTESPQPTRRSPQARAARSRRARRVPQETTTPPSSSESNPENIRDDIPLSTEFNRTPELTIQDIIEGFKNIKELGELDDRFLKAREAFMEGRESENGRQLREAYLEAGETLQMAMDAMVRKGAGLTPEEREQQGFPPTFAPSVEQINDAFSHDENETFKGWEKSKTQISAETSPDHDLESLFEQFPGESPLLKERFLKAREDYLHATKKKREKLKGTQKNIRLSPHEAKLRDAYLSTRNDLLYALTSIARPGAGFTRTESEKKRGLEDKGATVGAVLDTLIEGEQQVLGEDGFSTLHAYDSFEKTLLKDIRKRFKDAAKETKGKKKDEIRPLVARDFIERGDDLDALAKTVVTKREEYKNKILERRLPPGKKGMVDPMRVGLRKNPGFFSWIEDIFGRRPRRKS